MLLKTVHDTDLLYIYIYVVHDKASAGPVLRPTLNIYSKVYILCIALIVTSLEKGAY